MQSSPVQYVFTSPICPKESVGVATIEKIESCMEKMEESLNQSLDLIKKKNKPRNSVKSTKSTDIIKQQPKELNNNNPKSEPVATVLDSHTSVQASRDSKDLFVEIDKSPALGKIKDHVNNILASKVLTNINEVKVGEHQNTAKQYIFHVSTFDVAKTCKDFREEIQHSSCIIESPKETHNLKPRGSLTKRLVIN